MSDLFTIENLLTLIMLIFLQAVLGFDNLLYISIESKRVPEGRQAYVRKSGIAMAVLLRIALLFAIMSAIQYFQKPFFTLHITNVLETSMTLHSFIVLLGGVFLIYTAIKEIFHMLSFHDLDAVPTDGTRSVAAAICWIVAMNLIFSFDSILSALALTDVFAVMATAIVAGGLLMIWLSDHVTTFLEKNRMYEVLGLFILFIVGIMLLTEGGHLAHLKLFSFPIEPMTKTTFYFVLVVLVLVDLAQGRYQRKLTQMARCT